MSLVIIVFLTLLAVKLGVQLWLDKLNVSHVKQHAAEVPEAYREVMDEETYAKSVEYTLAKEKFGTVELIYGNVILVIVIIAGIIPLLWGALECTLGSGIWAQAATLFAISIILSLPDMPFDWWSTFKLEQRFGFNKSTMSLWITDKIKGLFIGALIGIPLIALLLLIAKLPLWWLWAGIFFLVFQMVMMVVFPMFIMPLFNKFEPLEEGPLREKLMALADRTGFLCKTILVMDGSRRSAHSNAYFTGFGKARRVVLFDTLVEQLTEDELEAVLAHEIGHYKCGHIWKMLGLNAVMTIIGFGVIGWLSESPWFLEGFGFAGAGAATVAQTFLMFSVFSGLLTFWLTPLTAIRSRKHEYEADAFAREAQQTPVYLIGALRKLNQKNLSNLTPHPKYSGFYYSHPTLLEREAALRSG